MIETQLIKKEEVNSYFECLRSGKEEYRNKLILGNYRLVIYIAKRYSGLGIELEDLVSIGTIGLIKAVDTFNLKKNISFSTYAGSCIKNHILVNLRKIKMLDKNINLQNEMILMNIISDSNNMEETVINNIDLYREKRILKKALDNLDKYRKDILYDYFGVYNKPLTQKEIAQKNNISRSYVSKIIMSTINELKNYISVTEDLISIKKLLTKKQNRNTINM